jgi:hypothetical protein
MKAPPDSALPRDGGIAPPANPNPPEPDEGPQKAPIGTTTSMWLWIRGEATSSRSSVEAASYTTSVRRHFL